MDDGNGKLSDIGTTGIRFDPGLKKRLQAAAKERTVSMTWIVNKLCAEGLDRLIPFDEILLTRDAQPTRQSPDDSADVR